MDDYAEVSQSLHAIEQHMRRLNLWQDLPPSEVARASPTPFCVDTLSPEQWLQWVFLPRMLALLEAKADLPRRFAIAPYFEVAYRDRLDELQPLLHVLNQFDQLLNCDESIGKTD